MAELLQRLRQRKMPQWALAYATGAWVLLQVLGLAADSYEWPRMVMRIGFGIAVLGFIATLILAWYHGERGEQKFSGTELLILAVMLAVGGGVLWQVERGTSGDKAQAAPVAAGPAPPAAAINQKSIAVLPFANLSSDKDNAYFADGIQDEILTRLAKIGDLKVISRTSTMRFASAPDNLPEIARQLGVANIVEGSVQKIGDRVRINVQLIQARSDTHLWAEIYDRKLDDIFSIQSEVAGAIALALQARLTQDEQRRVALKPTESSAAYDAYLKGLSLEVRDIWSTDMQLRARDQYAEATRLDPTFVEAWTRQVIAQSFLYFNGVERTPAALEVMRRHVDTVSRLRPDSGEAWIAKGYFHYRGLHDYPGAVAAFEQAAKALPNNAAVLGALGFVERRMGRLDLAMEHLRQAERLDPGIPNYATTIGEILAAQRRLPEARSALDRALALSPGDIDIISAKVSTYQDEGNLDAADQLLTTIATKDVSGPSLSAQFDQLMLRRRYDAIIARAKALAASDTRPGWNFRHLQYRLSQATAWRLKGDVSAAKAEFKRASDLVDDVRAGGVDESNLAVLEALIHAGLGDRASALDEIDRAIKVSNAEAKETPPLLGTKAFIHAQFGETDAALAILAPLLKVPYGTTPARLRLDPAWDPLRKDPRFQKLSAGSNPKR